MSEIVKEAKQFYKNVQEGAKRFESIPDKKLVEKIKKTSENAGEVVKHIEERSNPKQG